MKNNLYYGYYNGEKWNEMIIETFNKDVVDYDISLALDSLGYPHILYSFDFDYESSRQEILKYAYYNGQRWKIEVLSTVGGGDCLILDKSDNPHIIFVEWLGEEYVLQYGFYDGQGWHITSIDNGYNPKIVLDSLDLPYITYTNEDGSLKYMHYTGQNWQVMTVDSRKNTYCKSLGIALDYLNNPHIFIVLDPIRD